MGQVWPRFSHRVFGCNLDAMRVVNDAVQDGVGEPAAAEVLMPVGHGQLRGDDRGTRAVTLLDGLEEVLFLRLGEAGKAKIINDEQSDFAQAFEEPIVGALSAPLERKRMVALLIEDITLLKAERIAIHVRFRGGKQPRSRWTARSRWPPSAKQNPR